MKTLSLLLFGRKGSLEKVLFDELDDLGHDVKVSQVGRSDDIFDFVICLNSSHIVDASQLCQKVLVVEQYQERLRIILIADQEHFFEIESLECNGVDEQIELWGDAIIALSQREITTFPKIEYSFSKSTKSIASCPNVELTTLLPAEQQLFGQGLTIVQLFERQVKETPDALAVAFLDEQQTYRELNARANQLARHIRRLYRQETGQNIGPDTVIPLCVRRNLNLMVSVLGILKSGAAYVPINPDYPESAVKEILQDSQSSLVVTQDSLYEAFTKINNSFDEEAKYLVRVDRDITNSEKTDNLDLNVPDKSLAYVIYTSGTTGRSKGVMVEHCSVVNLIESQIQALALKKDSRVMLFTRIAFDASVGIMFPTLCSGGCLYVLPKVYMQDIQQISQFLQIYRINIISAVPSVLQDMNAFDFPEVKTIEIGAEVASQSFLEQWLDRDVNIINSYGPTESTVCATHHQIKESAENNCIGRAIQNMKCYVLDENLNQVDEGELHISGIGLARGYLYQESLTQKLFTINPFVSDAEKDKYGRLYKTNDLVKLSPEGRLIFKGRNDSQVKLGGHRIELFSIDNHLLAYGNIIGAATILYKSQSSDRLISFIVLKEGNIVTSDDIKTYLSRDLPNYMVPGEIQIVEELPITSNRKVDRKVLYRWVDENASKSINIDAQTGLQKAIQNAWVEVFQLDNISIYQDFYELGGNSLKATSLLMKLNGICVKQKAAELTLAFVFKNTTIVDQAQYIEASIGNKGGNISYQVDPHLARKTYPISRQQARYYFLNNYDLQGKLSFIVPLCFKFEEGLQPKTLGKAVDKLVKRHPIFSYAFIQEQDSVVQHQQPCLNNNLNVKELTEAEIKLEIEESTVTPFDLSAGYMYRFVLYKVKNDSAYIFSFIHHHIIADGWSLSLLFKELKAIYEHYSLETKLDLIELRVNYGDYSIWEQRALDKDIFSDKKQFWQDYLKNYEPLNLKPVIQETKKKGASFISYFSVECRQAIQSLIEIHSITSLHALHAGLSYLLHRYSGQQHITIGILTANRFHHSTESIVGPFINIIPLQLEMNENIGVSEYMKCSQESCLNALANQEVPFDDIVTLVNPDRLDADQSLVSVWLVIQDKLKDVSDFSIDGLGVSEYPVHQEDAQADLVFNIYQKQDELKLVLKYAANKFSESFISALVEHFQNTLISLANGEHKQLAEIDIFSAREYNQILAFSRGIEKDYPKNKTIHQLFQKQVEKTPGNIAVVYENQKLTYKALNEKANQLARYIRKQYKQETKAELKPDTLIALCLNRSFEMIIAILGVLKAGAAYVPIDPSYPEDRINYILGDIQCKLLLTQSHIEETLQAVINTKITMQIINVDTKLYESEQPDNLPEHCQSTDLAYVIHTSGTTGKPKGVLQTHGNVQRLFSVTDSQFGFDNKDIWTLYHSYIFDFSVWEIWGALTFGGKLVIPNKEMVKDIPSFVKLCIDHKVTILNQTPAAFYSFSENITGQQIKTLSLRYVVFGGDVLNVKSLGQWWEKSKGGLKPKLINMYGITETTVHVTYKEVLKDEKISSNIGKVINDLDGYVLDQSGQLVPINVVGELHIGGAGLARGYLNQPKLTEASFIPNLFASKKDKAKGYNRLYKTGDLVRWLPDGDLEYIGRSDFQVQIRGFRIELGEIESALLSIEGIKQVRVLSKNTLLENDQTGGQKYLVAYYIANKEASIVDDQLIIHLNQSLPDYMVPSAFVKMECFPLTINGKLDRKALPETEFQDKAVSYVGPKNASEQLLCQLWQESLDKDKVGIQDDFFKIGGNSILAIQIAYKISQLLDVACTVGDIFSLKTIEKLCHECVQEQSESFTGEL